MIALKDFTVVPVRFPARAGLSRAVTRRPK
jgi:hypothetical protein